MSVLALIAGVLLSASFRLAYLPYSRLTLLYCCDCGWL